MDSLIRPLGLRSTVPSPDDSASFRLTGYDRDSLLGQVARPYDWQDDQLIPVAFRYGFGPAAGLMSSVSDLARYSAAIDEGRLLQPQTWEKVFSPFVTPKGKEIPYGLGWYVREYRGQKVVWHTGWWTGYSAMFVKVPEKGLTFIVLANSQDLSRPFYRLVRPLPGFAFFHPFRSSLNKDLLASAFARAFFRHFVEVR